MFRRSGSIRLFRVFGIRVGVDASWFLILFLMIYLLSRPFRDTLHSSDGVAYVTTVVTVLLLFASIVVHELGHALVARRLGVGVTQIDLYLFGGLTQMTREPDTPGEDFKISAAGPAATLGVIVLCLVIAEILLGGHRLYDAVALDTDIRITPAQLAITWLIPVNILLLAFNLLPAFPLDGGKIARSIVWRVTGDKRRGTMIAARLGQLLAVLLAALGLYLLGAVHSFGGLYTLVLAWMLYTAAKGALVQADFSERIDGVTVADIMEPDPVAIPDSITVTEAQDAYFWRYRYPWFPVVDEGGRFLGVVRETNVAQVVDGGEGWLRISSLVESEGAAGWRVRVDGPLSELLGSGGLAALGAVMAIDRDGVLRGVVTTDRVRRAMSTVLEP